MAAAAEEEEEEEKDEEEEEDEEEDAWRASARSCRSARAVGGAGRKRVRG